MKKYLSGKLSIWRAVVLLLVGAGTISAQNGSWRITQLPIRDALAPMINNSGEIVWFENLGGGIFSSVRGKLADSGLYPQLANSGEVVYADSFGEPAWDLVSTTRGRLTYGAVIDVNVSSFDVNASGEVVYVKKDANGISQVYSTVRNQITFDEATHYNPCISDSGEIVWNQYDFASGSLVVSSTRGVVSAANQTMIDMNNFGEFCFSGDLEGPAGSYSSPHLFSSAHGVLIDDPKQFQWGGSINDAGTIVWYAPEEPQSSNWYVYKAEWVVGTSVSEHGGYGKITVQTTGPWTASNPASWITIVSGSSGEGSGAVRFYVMPNGSSEARSASITIGELEYQVTQPGRRWRIVGATDFDVNGSKDFLWQNSDGRVAGWLLEGSTRIGTLFYNGGRPVSPGWMAVGLNDFDNDDTLDILWQHMDGRIAIWYLDGMERKSKGLIPSGLTVPFGWMIKAVADLDGDGKRDIVLTHFTGRVALWRMNGTDRISDMPLNNNLPTRRGKLLVGAGDFDGDNKEDLLWRHADGRLGIWYMDGATRLGAVFANGGAKVGLGWQVGTVDKFNDDQHPDIAWYHTDRRSAFWYMDGANRTNATLIGNPNWGALGTEP